MSKNKWSIYGWFFGALSLLVMAAAGCGGPECADGTEERDGECVLEEGLAQCADDEVLKEGQCVATADLCDAGTTFDVDAGRCVLEDGLAQCADDEVLKEGQCVATADLCDGGTTFDVDAGRCVLEDGLRICEDDEILSDGRCVVFEEVCDEGTTLDLESGQCVLVEELALCEDNEVLKDGQCVATDDLCDEEGTVFDVDQGQCVLADGLAVCESGEVLMSGQCVATDDLCDEGTVFDVDDAMCVLVDELALCADDEVLYDSNCIPLADLCSQGTTLDIDSASCVTDADSCGANTSFEDGECVAEDPVTCGEFSQLDPTTNECVVTDEVCGPNTAFSSVDGTCVPTDEVCDEGTNFSDDTGLCLPDAQCKPGDVILDGICVSSAAALADDADVVAGPNTNPEFGGVPSSVDDVDIGVEVVFSGTIAAPTDQSGDGELDQHYDFYRFDAEAGDWFELSVQAYGSTPTPHFAVMSSDAADQDVDFYRESASGTGQDKARQIVIPEDGTYWVMVATESVFAQDQTLIGDDDWNYVGTIEQIAAPDADETFDYATENLTGDLGRLDDSFVKIDGLDDNSGLEFSWQQVPSTADATVTAWASPTEFIGEFSANNFGVVTPDVGEMYIIVDWQSRFGSFDTSYEISVEETVMLVPGASITEDFVADDGDVVRIEQDHDGFGSVLVTITDSSGTVIAEDTVSTFGDLTAIDLDADTYTVTFTNEATTTREHFLTSIEVRSPSLVDTVDLEEFDFVELNREDSSGGTVGVIFYDDDADEVVDYRDSFYTWSTMSLGALEQGQYSAWIFNFDDSPDLSDVDLVVDVGTSTEIDSFTVDAADEGDVLEITQSNPDDADVDLALTYDDAPEVLIDSGRLSTDDDMLRSVGVHSGTYNVYAVDWGQGVDDITITTRFITPEPISDFTATYSGTANESDMGEQDYYAIELDETTTYEMTLQHDDGSGWGRLFVYQWGDDLIERMDNYVSSGAPTRTMVQTFEADTAYILRVGNDETSWSFDFDYTVSFEEQ